MEAYGPADASGSGGVQWLVSDQLRTPRMIFDQTGNLANVKRHDYLPFGEELMSQGLRSGPLGYVSGDDVRQQFTSKERDVETGLDYFAARYYSSIQGRFTSADTFGGLRVSPQTLNLYTYVKNNPLRFIDPTGHSPQDPDRPNPNKPCSENDPCDPDDNDTVVTITEAPHYIPSDKDLYTVGGSSCRVRCLTQLISATLAATSNRRGIVGIVTVRS